MSEQEQYSYQDDEITLKELILRIQEFWREIWKFKWIIAIVVIPFVAYFLYKAIQTQTEYPATLTFMVEEDEGGKASAISGILGQFGFGSPSSGYNLDRILELSKSRLILQQVFFKKINLDGKTDYIANHFIDLFEFHEKWAKSKKSKELDGFYFVSSGVEEFNRNEYKVLKTLLRKIKGSDKAKGIYQTSYNEGSGIMNLSIQAPSETISIAFLDSLYVTLSEYYVEKSIEQAKSTYDLIKSKTDSIQIELNSAQYALAKFQDENRNVFLQQESALREQRLQSKVSQYQVMYAEAVSKLELADFNLKSSTPFITLIDHPIPPIAPKMESKKKAVVIGAFLGILIASTIIVLRKIYRDTMKGSLPNDHAQQKIG